MPQPHLVDTRVFPVLSYVVRRRSPEEENQCELSRFQGDDVGTTRQIKSFQVPARPLADSIAAINSAASAGVPSTVSIISESTVKVTAPLRDPK